MTTYGSDPKEHIPDQSQGSSDLTERTLPQATRSRTGDIRLYIDFEKADSPLPKAYAVSLGVFGMTCVATPDEAHICLTQTVQKAQSHLTAGRTVIHLSSLAKNSPFSQPSESLKNNPEYGSRYHAVDGLQLVQVASTILRVCGSIEQLAAAKPDSANHALFEEALERSALRGESILVVDNTDANRASAEYQFSEGNSLTVVGSYKQAAELLERTRFDRVLLDLLMPTESFLLGPTTFERFAGIEFPAGVFLALVAARCGAKKITVVTDASHHAHPATALLDYVRWGDVFSLSSGAEIRFEQASMVAVPTLGTHVKDWDRACRK